MKLTTQSTLLLKVAHGHLATRGPARPTEYELDTDFDLATQTIVGVANKPPLSTFETNIRGTRMTIEACRHA